MAVGNPVPLGRIVVEAVGLATSEEVVAVADRSPSNLYRAHNQQILKRDRHRRTPCLGRRRNRRCKCKPLTEGWEGEFQADVAMKEE